MENSKNLFAKRLEQLGLKKQVDASVVVEEAQKKLNEIFGRNVESCLKVISFNKGTLKIAAKSSAWASECRGCQDKITDGKIVSISYTALPEEINH